MAFSKTVEKTLRILELISNSPEGITLSNIYRTLDLPKATVYDILQTLYKEDAIYYKDPYLKTYVIGSKIFAISQAYTKNSHLINFSKEKLKELSNAYGLTCFANKKVENAGVIIYKYEPQNAKIATSDVGTTFEFTSNVVGKTFIAYMSPEKQEKILKECENPVSLINELKEIRNNKYAIDNGVEKSYMCSYAVPVYNFENKVVGVLSASRVIENETEKDIQEEIKALVNVAEYVSLKQGYKGDFYENIK